MASASTQEILKDLHDKLTVFHKQLKNILANNTKNVVLSHK
jgi:hypothetical protein